MSEPKIIGLREANTILGKIKDPRLAKEVSAILFNNEEKVIYCKSCKKDIGIVDLTGKKPKYIKENGILSVRFRFDGNWGFQCSCGNNSIFAKSERGLLKSGGATKEDYDNKTILSHVPQGKDIKKIFDNLEKKQTKVIKTDNAIECDGFVIKG